MSRKYSTVFVMMAACLWGMLGIFVRKITQYDIASMDIVMLRCAGTTVCIGSYGLLFDRKLFRIKLKDTWCFIGTGIFSILFFNFCYFTTITKTSLSIAAIMLYTAPSFVMIMSALLFHEKLSVVKIIALVMAFSGCAFVSGIVGTTVSITGTALLTGIGAGIGYALYSIFGRYALNRGYTSLSITFYTFLIGFLGTIPMTDSVHTMSVVVEHRDIWIYVVALILFATLLAYVLYTIGLKYIEAGKASIIACIEPVVATISGLIIYGEQISIWSLLGILCVVGSVVLVNMHDIMKIGNK